MRKYIIFRAEKREPDWKERKLQHTQALTRILAEYFDSSDRPIPEPGYRPTEFIRVDALHNSKEHGVSTHYRQGDWEVTRVETYTPEMPMGEFDLVAICYCKYSPINASLNAMPERQVSVDSFGGDERAYKDWVDSQKEPVELSTQH
ncbi:hypothetical protein H6G20_16660 [Desertifilum sp. FACHB-1129]|uniref:Uncharacterized protein n=2 Tax=Desertifilum tharense IPPAS B-1220 TaxID=1781255 RepID=A0A1E5QEJ4_9CYAN|nr:MULTISPECIES: hypothetical protein [Desertifilum]MDA0211974.1 hypothetical protein [Cyanobacteria bacterium FC1]MBD2313300.1 hypothetical protein [Desertifilum sp. FACHB-1129]MBD2324239.1 hypothetical protein [Desertifilum sp. FACHB-866]MBD2334253.1 hypothetical protein [Desertifilum sp. FACHB-868]OEJ73057.1 hypothetical protein BH720_21115 [Desertifilum tharense IPPAS B-1220]